MGSPHFEPLYTACMWPCEYFFENQGLSGVRYGRFSPSRNVSVKAKALTMFASVVCSQIRGASTPAWTNSVRSRR